jgi:hypothetical protein
MFGHQTQGPTGKHEVTRREFLITAAKFPAAVPRLFVALITGFLVAQPLGAQTKFTAWSLPTVAQGNFETKNDYGVRNDFEVVRPITVTELGMFDHGGDGIQGSAVVRVQLYEVSGYDTLLLETVTFDAANPGELRGGFRFRPLKQPVTLTPGRYTLTANGFDETNPAYDVALTTSTTSPVILNDGAGCIRFLLSNRYFDRGDRLGHSKKEVNIGPPERRAAGRAVAWAFPPIAGWSGRAMFARRIRMTASPPKRQSFGFIGTLKTLTGGSRRLRVRSPTRERIPLHSR